MRVWGLWVLGVSVVSGVWGCRGLGFEGRGIWGLRAYMTCGNDAPTHPGIWAYVSTATQLADQSPTTRIGVFFSPPTPCLHRHPPSFTPSRVSGCLNAHCSSKYPSSWCAQHSLRDLQPRKKLPL